jgi:hypothetical protein
MNSIRAGLGELNPLEGLKKYTAKISSQAYIIPIKSIGAFLQVVIPIFPG